MLTRHFVAAGVAGGLGLALLYIVDDRAQTGREASEPASKSPAHEQAAASTRDPVVAHRFEDAPLGEERGPPEVAVEADGLLLHVLDERARPVSGVQVDLDDGLYRSFREQERRRESRGGSRVTFVWGGQWTQKEAIDRQQAPTASTELTRGDSPLGLDTIGGLDRLWVTAEGFEWKALHASDFVESEAVVHLQRAGGILLEMGGLDGEVVARLYDRPDAASEQHALSAAVPLAQHTIAGDGVSEWHKVTPGDYLLRIEEPRWFSKARIFAEVEVVVAAGELTRLRLRPDPHEDVQCTIVLAPSSSGVQDYEIEYLDLQGAEERTARAVSWTVLRVEDAERNTEGLRVWHCTLPSGRIGVRVAPLGWHTVFSVTPADSEVRIELPAFRERTISLVDAESGLLLEDVERINRASFEGDDEPGSAYPLPAVNPVRALLPASVVRLGVGTRNHGYARTVVDFSDDSVEAELPLPRTGFVPIVFACDGETLDLRRTVDRLEIKTEEGREVSVIGQRHSSMFGGNSPPPPEVQVRLCVRELEVLSVSLRPLDGEGPGVPLGVVDTRLADPEPLRADAF